MPVVTDKSSENLHRSSGKRAATAQITGKAPKRRNKKNVAHSEDDEEDVIDMERDDYMPSSRPTPSSSTRSEGARSVPSKVIVPTVPNHSTGTISFSSAATLPNPSSFATPVVPTRTARDLVSDVAITATLTDPPPHRQQQQLQVYMLQSPNMRDWNYDASSPQNEDAMNELCDSSESRIELALDDDSSTQDTVIMAASSSSSIVINNPLPITLHEPLMTAEEEEEQSHHYIDIHQDVGNNHHMIAQPPSFLTAPVLSQTQQQQSMPSTLMTQYDDAKTALHRMLFQTLGNKVLEMSIAKLLEFVNLERVDSACANTQFRFPGESNNLLALSQTLSYWCGNFVLPTSPIETLSNPETPKHLKQDILSWHSTVYCAKLLGFLATGDAAFLPQILEFGQTWYHAVQMAINQTPDIYSGLKIVSFISCQVISLLVTPRIAQDIMLLVANAPCGSPSDDTIRCNNFLATTIASRWVAPKRFVAHLVFTESEPLVDCSAKQEQAVKDIVYFGTTATRCASSEEKRAEAINGLVSLVSNSFDAKEVASILNVPDMLDTSQAFLLRALLKPSDDQIASDSEERVMNEDMLNLTDFFGSDISSIDIGICPLHMAPLLGTLVKDRDTLDVKIDNASSLTIEPSGIIYI